MKVFIFGGKGFIGSALADKMAALHHVVILDLPKEDIRHSESFTKFLTDERPDVVINLAAVLGTMKEGPSVGDLFETNTFGNLKLLKAVHNARIRNYVFTSSMVVHGKNAIGNHHTRFSLFHPMQPYSASKAAAELSMMQFPREAPEMKMVVVRPTMVIGKDTYMQHAPIDFIKTMLSGKDIEIYGEGTHEREWIWIDDVVDGIIKAMEFGMSAEPGYYPFFLSGSRISMRDLAQKVSKKLGGKVVFAPPTSQAFTLTADSTESQSLLNWSPQYDMDTMIDKIIETYKDRPRTEN